MGIDKKETIFIPIAACTEYFIEHTIKSALSMADYPDRIFFGIYNNIFDKSYSLLDNDFITSHPNIFYVEVISTEALGVGFARMSASLLVTQQHDYIFQTDAHAMFSKSWDTIFIDTFSKISKNNNTDKIILTGMPGLSWSYEENNIEKIFANNTNINDLSIESFYDNSYATEYKLDNGLPDLKFDGYQNNIFNINNLGRPITHSANKYINGDYEEVNCIHATIMFSKYNIVREILHDPEDPFHGDQINFAIRAISRNYKIFAVKQPLMILLGKTKNNNGNIEEINDKYNWRAINNKSNKYQNNKFIVSEKNYEAIINGKYFGYWGAPDKQSLIYAKGKMGYTKSPPSGLN